MILGFLILAASTDLSGVWLGRMVIVEKELPKPATKQAKARQDQRVALGRKVRFQMILSKGGTYSMTITGLARTQTNQGTWKVKGTTLSRTLLRSDGKAVNPPYTASFRIEKGGARLVGTSGQYPGVRTEFVRGK